MIFTLFRLATNPLALIVIGTVAAGGAYKVGSWVGYAEGKADQKAAQARADVAHTQMTIERVRDALDQIGADTSDDAVNGLLRQLAGE